MIELLGSASFQRGGKVSVYDERPAQQRNYFRGDRIELEQMDSTDTPLAVYCLHGGRHRQRRRGSPEQVYEQAGPLGGIRARLAIFHRPVLVRSAICREVAQRTTDGVKNG